MRFDEIVRRGHVVRDVKVRHPESRAVFENHGFRESCDDCSIEQVARKHGLRTEDLLEELNRSIFGHSG